jgi:MFS transporter, CP family, cyanate transporter
VNRPGGSTWALIAILAVAVNLRIAVVAVGPLIERIRDDLDMSRAAVGLLSTIPFACMGVLAFVGPALLQRHGAGRVLVASTALLAAAICARSAMPVSSLVVLATVPVGVAIAVMGTLLPAVVKRWFPARPGAVTGGYVAALGVGAGVATLAMVPLADALGGWRLALACGALPCLLALGALAAARLPREAVPEPSSTALRRHPARWWPALLFASQSIAYTGVITWVAAAYEDAGWTAHAAGLATAGVTLLAVPASLAVPALSDRRGRGAAVIATTIVMAVGIAGLALVPTAAPWVWLTLFAVGNGALFPLTLTVPLDVATGPQEAATLSAWAQGLGYGISACGPVAVGALRDVTGSFAVPFLALAIVCLGAIVLAHRIPDSRLRERHQTIL